MSLSRAPFPHSWSAVSTSSSNGERKSMADIDFSSNQVDRTFNSNCLRVFKKLLYSLPRNSAALRAFPLKCVRVIRVTSLSICQYKSAPGEMDSRQGVRDTVNNREGKWSGFTTSLDAITTVLLMAFRSSRTFPGQGY